LNGLLNKLHWGGGLAKESEYSWDGETRSAQGEGNNQGEDKAAVQRASQRGNKGGEENPEQKEGNGGKRGRTRFSHKKRNSLPSPETNVSPP